MTELELAKKKLSESLRDRMSKYWEVMKDWYKRKISKEKFDSEAKLLLGENNAHLHNEFLFAVLVKCQTGISRSRSSSSSESSVPPSTPPNIATPPTTSSPSILIPTPPPLVKTPTPPLLLPLPPTPPIARKPTPPPVPEPEPEPEPEPQFLPPPVKKPRPLPPPEIPYHAFDSTKRHEPPAVMVQPRDLDHILLCSHELMLPDLCTLHTRMLLVAWELELDNVSENAAELLLLALRLYLKNIVQALICSQSSWQNKKGSYFQHSFGFGPSSRPLLYPSVPVEMVWDTVRSGSTRKAHLGEAEAVRLASLNVPVRNRVPLNLFHLRDALKVNTHCIPIQSMYALTMERILAAMWHPSEEEEAQNKVVEKWQEGLSSGVPYAVRTTLTNGYQ